MSRIVGRPAEQTTAKDLAVGRDVSASPATERNRLFVSCVNEVIDTSGVKRQTLASDGGYSEFQFSRYTSAQAGCLDLPDRLPDDLQRNVARRYAEVHGFTVTEPVTEETLARLANELQRATRVVNEITAAHLRSKMRGR